MKDTFIKQLESVTPEVPEPFHQAMCTTLDAIVQDEKEANMLSPKTVRRISRSSIILCFVLVLLATSIAVAMTLNSHIFSTLWGDTSTDDSADRLIQRDLASKDFGQYRVEIREAAYDGASLYILYSITDSKATAPFDLPDGDSFSYVEDWNMGWWYDSVWINGMETDMSGGSTGIAYGTDVPGELLCYQLHRLDQADIHLSGQTRITLPIGAVQPLNSLHRDDDGLTIEPTDGTVSFILDCDRAEGITHLEPNVEAHFPDGTAAHVSQAHFTPIKLYVELDYTLVSIPESPESWEDESAVDAYFQAMAEAIGWVGNMQLVDDQGKPVFSPDELSDYDGCNGSSFTHASFVFPYSAHYPEHMYLACTGADGAADMTRAVQIR